MHWQLGATHDSLYMARACVERNPVCWGISDLISDDLATSNKECIERCLVFIKLNTNNYHSDIFDYVRAYNN